MENNNEFELLKEKLQEEELKYWQAKRNGCDEIELKHIEDRLNTIRKELAKMVKR
jgi:hypothetical protein